MTYTSTSTELVQSLFEAFGRGDINFILQHLAPDCRWVVPGQGIPASGTYQGREGAAQFFRKLSETEPAEDDGFNQTSTWHHTGHFAGYAPPRVGVGKKGNS